MIMLLNQKVGLSLQTAERTTRWQCEFWRLSAVRSRVMFKWSDESSKKGLKIPVASVAFTHFQNGINACVIN